MNRLAIALVSFAIVVGVVAVVSSLQRPTAAVGTLDGVQILVHKTASCECCGGWIDAMKEQGAVVTAHDTDDIVRLKVEHAVPSTHYSCHTAEIDGYVVEGHVPVKAVVDLLSKGPDVRGIALGGMPEGSPGMPGTQRAPFDVVAFGDKGVTAFGSY